MNVTCIALFFLVAAGCIAQQRDSEFNKLADRFFDEAYFKYDPVAGTSAGFHQYDAMLSSATRAEIEAQVAALRKFEGEVEGFGAQGLSPLSTADRELLLAQIRGQLLSLEVIRPWEKNPDVYSSGATNAVYVIMSRKFAPGGGAPEERDRAREVDSRPVSSGARQSQEPAENLHRSGARTARRHLQLFSERRARSLQGCHRRAVDGRVQAHQPGSARRAQGLPGVSQRRSAAALPRRFPDWRRNLSQEAALRRDGRYSAGPPARNRHRRPAPQSGGVQAGGRAGGSEAHGG